MLKSRAGAAESIHEGAVFRGKPDPETTALAKVVSLSRHGGIPHVRFEVRFERRCGKTFVHGSRSLALESFARIYREPVAEQAFDALD